MKKEIYIKEYHIESLNKNSSLRDYFSKSIIAIPELQRNFVWNAARLRDLADSIFKGYSIGTFTIWDTPKKREYLLKHLKGYLPPYHSQNNDRIHYVIDGQQRLSVLWGFLNISGMEITNDYGKKFNSRNVCFSIIKNEEGLNFSYVKKGPDNKRFFSLCDILSPNYKTKFHFLSKKHKNRFKKIEECRNKFLRYPFVFVYINKDIKENNLRETFIRLNTRGLSLRALDRNYAYASKVHLRERILRIKEGLGIFKTVTDTPIHELIYMIFKSEEKSYRFNSQAIGKIFQKIDRNKEYQKKLGKELKIIGRSLERAVKFLKSECGVKSIHFIPSLTMVSVLAIFYYYYRRDKLTSYTKKQLKKWFWFSAVSGRYSGRGYYSFAAKDIITMKTLADKKRKDFEEFKKRDKNEIDNSLYYQNKSSLVRAFYCLLALQKPREFYDGEIPISLEEPSYRERKENHHIFPESLMEDIVPDRKYNSIVNICFLPKHKNASFNNDPPHLYLNSKEIDKPKLNKILDSHLIPPSIRNIRGKLKENFNDFYNRRKQILIKNFENEAGIKIFD